MTTIDQQQAKLIQLELVGLWKSGKPGFGFLRKEELIDDLDAAVLCELEGRHHCRGDRFGHVDRVGSEGRRGRKSERGGGEKKSSLSSVASRPLFRNSSRSIAC
jgi:hypothetical protein